MTEGTEWKQILLFALPILLGNLLQQLYNTVDTIVVGNYVSQDALAAVGGCFPMVMLLLSISMGMGGGGSVIVAQYYGGGRMDEMRRAVSTLIIMLVSMGVVFTVIGVTCCRWLVVDLLRVADPSIQAYTIEYFQTYAFGLVIQYLYNAISSVLRSLGDSKSTSLFLCVAAIINVVLDLYFVLGLGLGVFGVALATVLSQIGCCTVSIIYMLKRYPMFRFKRSEFVFDVKIFKIALRLGVPATIQHSIMSFGNILIQRLVNSFGAYTMTAFTIGHRIESYAMMPMFALNLGLSTFTGQNVGAGKFDRARRGLFSSVTMALIELCVICPMLYFFSPWLAQVFGAEGEALRQSIEMIRFMSFAFFIFAFYQPTAGFLQGAGDAMVSTAASITLLGVRVICAYGMVYLFDFGYNVAWTTMPIGWVCAGIITYTRFFSGKWKSKALVRHDEPEQGELSA